MSQVPWSVLLVRSEPFYTTWFRTLNKTENVEEAISIYFQISNKTILFSTSNLEKHLKYLERLTSSFPEKKKKKISILHFKTQFTRVDVQFIGTVLYFAI